MKKEEVIQWLTNEKWKNANNKYKKEWNEAFDLAIEALSKPNYETDTEVRLAVTNRKKEMEDKGLFKRVDFVEVVRCKDCRWYENRYGEVCHNPRYGDGHANYSPPYVDEEYFCKDGERREQ